MRPELVDSAALSDCNTSLNIETVSDLTASSMSDGAILPSVSSGRRSGTYPPKMEKTWVLSLVLRMGNLPTSALGRWAHGAQLESAKSHRSIGAVRSPFFHLVGAAE